MPPRTPVPDEHECTQQHRLLALEQRASGHSDRIAKAEAQLIEGRIQFAAILKDLAQIQTTLVKMEAAMSEKDRGIGSKIMDAVIFWAVPVVCGSFLWVIVNSGQIPGIK